MGRPHARRSEEEGVRVSTHPNAILALALNPHGLSRKTMAAILAEYGGDPDDGIQIGDVEYDHRIMESDYDDGMQIAAKEGELVFSDMVTYGYGETIEWEKLEQQKNQLEAWAKEMCQKHQCDYRIFVTANYF